MFTLNTTNCIKKLLSLSLFHPLCSHVCVYCVALATVFVSIFLLSLTLLFVWKMTTDRTQLNTKFGWSVIPKWNNAAYRVCMWMGIVELTGDLCVFSGFTVVTYKNNANYSNCCALFFCFHIKSLLCRNEKRSSGWKTEKQLDSCVDALHIKNASIWRAFEASTLSFPFHRRIFWLKKTCKYRIYSIFFFAKFQSVVCCFFMLIWTFKFIFIKIKKW